jgi:hypothetical protein
MKYFVSALQSDQHGFGFSVKIAANPARFVTFSFDDIKTAQAMAAKMHEILEVCVSVTT